MSDEAIDLGHKRTCPHCGVKYYDFYQDELNCPECGKSIEPANISRPKRGKLGGVSAAIFTPEAAKKVVDQAISMLKNPPESDHPMNMWQVENLTQHQEKCEHQIKDKTGDETKLPEHAYWITARSAGVWSHERKLGALKRFI